MTRAEGRSPAEIQASIRAALAEDLDGFVREAMQYLVGEIAKVDTVKQTVQFIPWDPAGLVAYLTEEMGPGRIWLRETLLESRKLNEGAADELSRFVVDQAAAKRLNLLRGLLAAQLAERGIYGHDAEWICNKLLRGLLVLALGAAIYAEVRDGAVAPPGLVMGELLRREADLTKAVEEEKV